MSFVKSGSRAPRGGFPTSRNVASSGGCCQKARSHSQRSVIMMTVSSLAKNSDRRFSRTTSLSKPPNISIFGTVLMSGSELLGHRRFLELNYELLAMRAIRGLWLSRWYPTAVVVLVLLTSVVLQTLP